MIKKLYYVSLCGGFFLNFVAHAGAFNDYAKSLTQKEISFSANEDASSQVQIYENSLFISHTSVQVDLNDPKTLEIAEESVEYFLSHPVLLSENIKNNQIRTQPLSPLDVETYSFQANKFNNALIPLGEHVPLIYGFGLEDSNEIAKLKTEIMNVVKPWQMEYFFNIYFVAITPQELGGFGLPPVELKDEKSGKVYMRGALDVALELVSFFNEQAGKEGNEMREIGSGELPVVAYELSLAYAYYQKQTKIAKKVNKADALENMLKAYAEAPFSDPKDLSQPSLKKSRGSELNFSLANGENFELSMDFRPVSEQKARKMDVRGFEDNIERAINAAKSGRLDTGELITDYQDRILGKQATVAQYF